MDDQTKCEIYTKLLNTLNKNNVKMNEEINRTTYNNQIRLIKTDILSTVDSDQKTALQMLKILIENNVFDIQQEVITILRDNDVDQELKTSIIDSIKNYIKDLLQSNNITSLASLYANWRNYDLQQFYELLGSASLQDVQDNNSQSEPINFANLIIEHFLPMMSTPTEIHLKQPLIEVTSKIAEMYPISSLSAEEYQEVLKKVPVLLRNLVNLQKSHKDVWREPLHFLTEYLDTKLYSPEVQALFSNSSLNWDLVRADLESSIKIELIKYISENNLISTAVLYKGWKKLDPQKFTTTLKEICHNKEYIMHCKIFFFDKLIPVIMAPKEMAHPMKVYYIDIALEFAGALPLTKLSPEEYTKFIGSVNDYIKNISDLRDMQFEHWHKLWITLVRLFGKKLHHSMSLINKLLRVVEHAFRNPNYEQRIRGYNCWKELIDNVSIDNHHLSSEKQIRLLLTPLRAKFSKQEAVIVKRFEVFVYLIEKLQDKSLLVLKEFLEFCFGEVGEDTDPNKSGQGKSLPELWHRSAKVLLAMLGHSHDSSEDCLDSTTELCVRGPVLNSNNISNHYCHTINAVAESCILLKEVDLDKNKESVFRCFWTSLLHIVLNNNVAKKDKCIEILDKVLGKLLKDDDPYCNSIAAEILKSTIKIDQPKALPFVLHSLEHFIRMIFSVPFNKECYLEIEKFQIMLCTVESAEVASKITRNLFHCFADYHTIESNANFVAQFWIYLINELDDTVENKCLSFLVWPALHIHHVTDSIKQDLIYENYEQIVIKFVNKSDELELGLLKNFEKILKNNPLLTKNILALVTMFTPKTENKEITNVTLDILDLMMVVPVTEDSSNQRQNLERYLRKFYELNVTHIHDHDTIKKLCTCLQHVLKAKHYDILAIVEATLKPLPDNIKWVHGKFLSLDFLMDLFEKETNVVSAEKLHKLINVLRNVKCPETKKEVTSFIPLGGRSARIAKLVKQIPSSPGKRSDSPTTLRLFGKDVETHSPLGVKGSQLKEIKGTPDKAKTVTPTKAKSATKKPKKAWGIDDESNSKFVLIESEVKLDKNKLTEHQKEAFKKRRDIPALYQDLSQSLESSSTSSVFKKPEETFSKEIHPPLEAEREREKCIEVHDSINTESNAMSVSKDKKPIIEIEANPVIDMAKVAQSTTDSLGSESKNMELTKTGLIKAAVEAELKKLSMSIVGAEEFIATKTKRKRREKKRDLDEHKATHRKEKKVKVPRAITPKIDKTSSTIIARVLETDEDPIVANLPEDDQVKKRGENSKRKIISNKLDAEISPNESIQQDSTTKSEDNAGRIDNIPEKLTAASTKETEIVKKKKTTLDKKTTVFFISESSFKAVTNEETDNKSTMSSEHVLSTMPTEVVTTGGDDDKVKGLPAKSDHLETACKSDKKPQTKATKKESNEIAETNVTEVITASTIIINPDNKQAVDSKEADTSTKEVILSNTPKVAKRRGRPPGVKRSPSRKRDSAESTPKGGKYDLRPQTPITILESIDKNVLLVEGDSSVIAENNIDNEKQKRGRFGGKRKSLSKEDDIYRPSESIAKTEGTEVNIYQFDTEQERTSESEIGSLRSSNKDEKISVAANDISGVDEAPPTGRKSKRKSIPTEKLTQSELFKLSEPTRSSPGQLKSKKLITSSCKVPQPDKKVYKTDNLPVQKSTQSELFKQTNEENGALLASTECNKTSELTESGEVFATANKESESILDNIQQTDTEILKLKTNDIESDIVENTALVKMSEPLTSKNPILKSNENIFRKEVKRKKSYSEEDEDIIESSQESTISNLSGARLKLSITKRSSFDKTLIYEIKQNVEENKSEEIVAEELQYKIDNDKDKISEVIPEEKKKRGRPFKSKSNTTTPQITRRRGRALRTSPTSGILETANSEVSRIITGVQEPDKSETLNDNDITKLDVSPEESNQSELIAPAQSNIYSNKISTSPEQRKGKRGRSRKSLPSDNLLESCDTDKEGLDESESPVAISGRTLGISEGSVLEMGNSEYTPQEEKKGKRGSPRKRSTSNELLESLTEFPNSDKEGLKESQSLVSVTGKCIGEDTVSGMRKSESTSPKERKGKRGRLRRSPAIDELLGSSSDCLNSDKESLKDLKDLATFSGKSSGISEGILDMGNSEVVKSKQSKASQPNVLNSAEKRATTDEPKPKRKRRRNETLLLLDEASDENTSEDSTNHTLEATNKISSETISFNEKPKQGKRQSPRKNDKYCEKRTQHLIQEVQKQVFVETFKEPIDLDISTQKFQKRTQSQDTQTQDTAPLDITDEIQLQLDVPQKPVLNEVDQEIARMDTASLSLGNLEDLHMSTSQETVMETNKTVMENRTITNTAAESESVSYSNERIRQDRTCIKVIMNEAATDNAKMITANVSLRNDLPELENIFNSGATKQVAESSELTEIIPETEDITTQVVTLDYESPVKDQTGGTCIDVVEPFDSSIPSSPVTGDTPNRTSELLNCTSDISPICSKSGSDKSNSDDEFVEPRKLVPVALKFEDDTDHETSKQKSPEKADDAPGKIDETSPEKAEKNVHEATSSSPPKDGARTRRDVKNIADRSSRLFDMVKGSPTTLRLFNKRKSGLNMSPSASRIKKLMSNVKAPSQTEMSDNVSQEDILTFTREVPSPLAVPKSSILKRKHSDTADDGMSPCPKRKRVNFSDPCTTSKKVFIKEGNVSSQCLFGTNSDDDLDKQFLAVLAANNIDIAQTDSDPIETEQSLQINNPLLLRDTVPIYPELVDCEEDVSVISRKLTSPMFVNTLLSKLNGRNIKTIGDLARQSELDIARLPFKTPMVANVFKALDNYYHKNFKSKSNKEKHETRINGELESVNETMAPLARLEVALLKMDVRDELGKILEKAKSQNISSDTICSLLFSTVDHKEVMKYAKAHFKLETKDIVDEKDFPQIVKHITETVGLPKIFEILTESLESSEDESVYFDCMIKYSIDKRPLSRLIEKRSLQELQAALWQNVENQMYTKRELLQACFLPFVNSIDLLPLFNKMTLVQIEEVVVTRLKTEDYPMFMKKILDRCHSNAAVKEQLLSHCTVSELTSTIIKKGTPQDVLSSFTYMFLSAKKGEDDLVQIFKLVCESLVGVVPPSKLMELSIEFQRKIPIKD